MTERFVGGLEPNEALVPMENFEALLFDLDGVITRSMDIHARAWKKLFDDYLSLRSQQGQGSFVPFDLDADYRAYVDGKPRYEGVDSFLRSRGISLPWGEPSDDPSLETVCGLGNIKNRYFLQEIETRGVEVYASSVQLIRKARAHGLKIAVVSSSRNCRRIVEAVGISDLFDTCVDGMDVERSGLKGKPAPDMFLEAARRLKTEPSRCAVFEDAISGVQAGRDGKFGMVVGVDRTGHPEDLLENGADIVVDDLKDFGWSEIRVDERRESNR